MIWSALIFNIVRILETRKDTRHMEQNADLDLNQMAQSADRASSLMKTLGDIGI